MRYATAILVAGFALALAAGVVVGRLSVRAVAAAKPAGPGNGHSWLADQLGLSADQRRQMDAIWHEAFAKRGQIADRRRQLGQDRDAAVRKLLPPAQQSAYDAAQAQYDAGRTALDAEDKAVFHEANVKSQALLTPEQKMRWDEIGPKGSHGWHRSPPASRPNVPVSSTSRAWE